MTDKIIPIFIPHLGCPNDCVFCNQKEIAARTAPDAEEVKWQIRSALRCTTMPQIAFYGGSFTAIDRELQKQYLDVAASFVESGLVSGVRISTRPDCISPEIVDFLKSRHVDTIELGAQSTDDNVLALSRRGHTAADIVSAAKCIKAGGLELVLQMMTGLPGTNDASDVNTAFDLASLFPDAVRIYPVCVIWGTELDRLYTHGKYKPHDLEHTSNLCANILGVFTAQGIPVLRIGLNPTKDLSSGAVIAGGYHPAMGELVRSRRLRGIIERSLPQNATGRAVVSVQKGNSPLVRGQKKCNMEYFAIKFPRLKLEIVEDPNQREEVVVKLVK